MADTYESSFGIKIDLGFNESQVTSAVRGLYEQAKLLGVPFEELQEEVKNLGNSFDNIISQKAQEALKVLSDNVKRAQNEFTTAVGKGLGHDELEKLAKKLDLAQKKDDVGSKNYKSNLRKKRDEMLASAVDNVLPKKVDLLQESFKRVGKVATGFIAVFAGAKKVYRFVDAIAKVNMQLRMLHYSSAMAVSSIRGAAGAMAVFGSSEQSIAQGAMSYNAQIARGKRGLGWGNLQEAGWQWGFVFNPNESYRNRLERAIRHARSLSEDERMAFAQTVDPANAKAIVSLSHLSNAAVSSHFRYSDTLANMRTAWGANRTESVTRSSQSFSEETNRLSQSWKSIKDEIAAALLPAMTRLVRSVRWITDKLNKYPQLLHLIVGIVGSIGLAVAAVGFVKWVGFVKETYKWLKQTAALMKGMNIASAASGVGGFAGGAAGAGRTAGGAIGSFAAGGISAISSVISAGAEVVSIFQRMGQMKVSNIQHKTEMGELMKVSSYVHDWKSEWEMFSFGKSGAAEKDFMSRQLSNLGSHYHTGDIIDAINRKNRMQDIALGIAETSNAVSASGGVVVHAESDGSKIVNNNMEFNISVQCESANSQDIAEKCVAVIKSEIKNAALFDSD